MEEFGINNSYNGPLNPLHCSRRMKYKHTLGFVVRPNTFKEPYERDQTEQSWAMGMRVNCSNNLTLESCQLSHYFSKLCQKYYRCCVVACCNVKTVSQAQLYQTAPTTFAFSSMVYLHYYTPCIWHPL